MQLPAFKHELLVQTSTVRIICTTVVVVIVVVMIIGAKVVVLVVIVVAISSHRVPVKFGAQTHTKPPSDVSEQVPPLKQGSIEHGLGAAVIRSAKQRRSG